MSAIEDVLRETLAIRAEMVQTRIPATSDQPHIALARRAHTARVVLAVAASVALIVAAVSVLENRKPFAASGPRIEVHGMSASPLRARSRYSSAALGNEVFLWGGASAAPMRLGPQPSYSTDGAMPPPPVDGPSYLADGARYDLDNDRWQAVSASPLSARADAAALVVRGHVYVVGGTIDDNFVPGNSSGVGLNSSADYDPATDSWSVLPTAPLCIDAAASVGSDIFVVGNECVPGTLARQQMARFDTVSRQWSSMIGPACPGVGRLLTWGQRIVAQGQASGESCFYNTTRDNWVTLPTIARVIDPADIDPYFYRPATALAVVGGELRYLDSMPVAATRGVRIFTYDESTTSWGPPLLLRAGMLGSRGLLAGGSQLMWATEVMDGNLWMQRGTTAVPVLDESTFAPRVGASIIVGANGRTIYWGGQIVHAQLIGYSETDSNDGVVISVR